MGEQRFGVVTCLRNEIPIGSPGWADRGECPSTWTPVSLVVGDKYEILAVDNPDNDIYTRVKIKAIDGLVIDVAVWTVWSYGVFEFDWDQDFLRQHTALRIFRSLESKV